MKINSYTVSSTEVAPGWNVRIMDIKYDGDKYAIFIAKDRKQPNIFTRAYGNDINLKNTTVLVVGEVITVLDGYKNER